MQPTISQSRDWPEFPSEQLTDEAWRRHLVMLIDDSLAVRRVIEFSFARVGMDVVCFPDGLSAIKALTNGDIPVPDVVLLDIGLPRMSGYEVAQILRSNPEFQRTIIVMLSVHDGVVHRVHSRMVGVREFVSKPFNSGDLVRFIREHLHLPPDADDSLAGPSGA